jgi:hypothetical protein
MAIEEEEARALYADLRASVAAIDELRWIVDDVDALIQQGVEERRQVLLEAQEPGRRRKREAVKVSRAYLPSEMLRLLIDAVERAVLQPIDLVRTTLSALEEAAGFEVELEFRPDSVELVGTIGDREGMVVSGDMLVEASERVTTLRELIAEFRRELE